MPNLTPKWSLCTSVHIAAHEVDGPSLHPSTWHLYTLLMLPTFRQRGVMWVGMATSRVWKTAEEGAFGASLVPPTAGVEASGSTPSDSWGGSLDMVTVGSWWHLLGGWGRGHGGLWYGSPQEPYKPSASDPAIANCDFCSASVSSLYASSLSALALLNKCSPWKRKKEKGICHNG